MKLTPAAAADQERIAPGITAIDQRWATSLDFEVEWQHGHAPANWRMLRSGVAPHRCIVYEYWWTCGGMEPGKWVALNQWNEP